MIGLALFLAGASLLGWYAWQVWGTNALARAHRGEVLREVEADWKRGSADVQTDWGEAFALIRIPKFGKGYEIPVFRGTEGDALSVGYGHFDDTAGPGEAGNFAVAAHRVTHGEPLRRMPELEPGDRVVVETRKATYTYELDTGGDDLVIPRTETWVTQPLPDNPRPDGPEPKAKVGQKLITLTTCAELFHTDDRMVAFGHLLSVEFDSKATPS